MDIPRGYQRLDNNNNNKMADNRGSTEADIMFDHDPNDLRLLLGLDGAPQMAVQPSHTALQSRQTAPSASFRIPATTAPPQQQSHDRQQRISHQRAQVNPRNASTSTQPKRPTKWSDKRRQALEQQRRIAREMDAASQLPATAAPPPQQQSYDQQQHMAQQKWQQIARETDAVSQLPATTAPLHPVAYDYQQRMAHQRAQEMAHYVALGEKHAKLSQEEFAAIYF